MDRYHAYLYGVKQIYVAMLAKKKVLSNFLKKDGRCSLLLATIFRLTDVTFICDMFSTPCWM